MSDQNDNSPINTTPTHNQRRRSSFAGQAFAEMFGRTRTSESSGTSPPSQGQGPITSAAAEASRRRMSLNPLGMGASPTQSSPFSTRQRGESVSSSNAPSVDESAVDDEPSSATTANGGMFARRVSFGARALKDMKGGGQGPAEGFNWADNMRSRAERGSIAASPPTASGWSHARAKSIAVMDHPVRDNPKPVNVPDQFQERILKGDFYMD